MSIDLKPFYKKITGRDYLIVAGRVAWFRDDYPVGGEIAGVISTDIIQLEPYPVVKAYITVGGVLIATGHGSAQEKKGAVWSGREMEKAETAAIGRALANAGYGMEYDDDDEHLADSPVERDSNGAAGNTPAKREKSAKGQNPQEFAYMTTAIETAESGGRKVMKLVDGKGSTLATLLSRQPLDGLIDKDVYNALADLGRHTLNKPLNVVLDEAGKLVRVEKA